MTLMLKLSDKRFKTVMINGKKALMEIADSMQEEIGNVTREMDTLRKKQSKMLKNP